MTSKELLEIRGYWQFAASCQFIQLFMFAFGVEFVDTNELEGHVIAASDWIIAFQIKMLRKYVKSRMAYLEDIWLSVLYKEFQKRLDPEEYIYEYQNGMTYKDLSLYQRVLLLHFICEIQFDSPEFKTKAESLYPDHSVWRVVPIGYDALGCVYWLYDDCRLYREAPWREGQPRLALKAQETNSNTNGNVGGTIPTENNSTESDQPAQENDTFFKSEAVPVAVNGVNVIKIKIKSVQGKSKLDHWTLMCQSAEEWLKFPDQFQNSTHPDEKELYKRLKNLVPLIIGDLELFKVKKQERDTKDAAKLARKAELEQQRAMVREQQRQREIAYAMEKQLEQEKKKDTYQTVLRSGRQSKGPMRDITPENGESSGEEYSEKRVRTRK